MARRIFIAANILSALLLAAALLCVIVAACGRRGPLLSMSQNLHIGAHSFRGADLRLTFYSDAELGPYSGWLIAVVGSDGKSYPPRKQEESFGDFLGVYYRYFEWYNGDRLCTLAVSLWYFVGLFAVLPTIWACKFARRCR